MDTLPHTLVSAVREQRAVLFLGAGANFNAQHPNNMKIPLGDGLRDLLSDKFLNGELKDRSLVSVAAMAASESDPLELQRYIRTLFEPFGPAAYHLLVPTFRWKALVSTNFDLIIEKAYKAVGKGALQRIVKSVKDGDKLDTRMSETNAPVAYYKIHGCIDHYTDLSIRLILGQEQYASYAENRHRFYSRIRDMAHEYPIVFCGYSIADPHIQQIIFDLTDTKVSRPRYYYVAPNITDIEARYWASHRIDCIKATFAEFLGALDSAIPTLARAIPDNVGGGALSIRKHYRVAAANESEALREYLNNSALHVHGAMSPDYQDPIEFYKGYDKGFGSISQNLDVRRSVCDSVLVDAVLITDEARTNVELHMIKGPAGNGKTVALKRIAWDAAANYDVLALWISSAGGLRRTIIEEIHELTGKRIFLFVDRVAILRNELHAFMRDCKSANLPVTIIGAERDNEWNFYCENLERFVRQEFAVRYLTEGAIRKLLELLERHKALGLLAEKPIEERIRAFTERAEKQILVALHETTMGQPFEKIILDEFENIRPDDAREIYLDICALHQFGAQVRAGLISRASGISFSDFGKRLIKPLENVVMITEDKNDGDVFYSSRHRHVAELVFNQVLQTDDERYEALTKLMQAMNIDYSSDNETWRRMVKGRTIAHMFLSVELGRLFYDRAEEVVPDASVLHQRAVFEMHHTGGSLILAERIAAKAIALNPSSRSIPHTQAEIARRQAEDTNDPLLKQSYRKFARDKLNQSGRSTDYDVVTRAKLALDELRDFLGSGNEVEQNVLLDVVRETQTTIDRGLQSFPESAEMFAVEASFRQLLDQADRARKALEKAFSANPRLEWLAMRLARSYIAKHQFSEAEKVLAKCLEDNPASKNAHLQMALVARRLDKSDALVLDHFSRSFTQGDNHYDGQFWYGRELFLQGHLEASRDIFARLTDGAPGRFRTGPSAVVVDQHENARFYEGIIDRKEEGYAFVRFVDFRIGVFASRADTDLKVWTGLRNGSSIKANVAFSRRGARAVAIVSN